MENAESRYTNKIGLRIMAIILIAVILFNLFISMQAQIKFSQMEFVGRVTEYAAKITEDNTPYLSKGTLDRAWDILRTYVRKPRTYDQYEMYSSIAIAREDYENAVVYMQGCIDTYDGEDTGSLAMLYLRSGSLYVLNGDYKAATTQLTHAIELDPSLSSAYFMRAEMYLTEGDTEKATEDVKKYLELDGRNPVILSSLGKLYENVGDPQDAIACYTTAIDSGDTFDAHLLVDRARCYMLTENIAGARKDLESYMEFSQEDANGEVSSMYGMCLMEGGEYRDAAEQFRNAIANGYAAPEVLLTQSMMCLYLAGQYAESAADGEKAIAALAAAGESTAEAELWTGLSYLVQSDYENASGHLEKAIAENPEIGEARYYLGVCLMNSEDWTGASKLFTESIERDDSTTVCLYNRAVCRLYLEDMEGAAEDFKAVVERGDDPQLTEQAAATLKSMGA